MAKSRSGTIYLRDGEFENSADAAAAREAGETFGTKWRWTNVPGVDSSDLEIGESIVADECFDIDIFVYLIDEAYGGEGRIEVVGEKSPFR